MNEPFILSVAYLGEEYELKARFERWGYTHRFMVSLNEDTVTFEPDEEGSYRAVGTVSAAGKHLLQTVADKLASLSK